MGELLERLAVVTADLVEQYKANPYEELTAWANSFDAQARECLDELHYLAPWLTLSERKQGAAPCPNPKCTEGGRSAS